jgi:toxin ParE1/3/4
VARVGITPEALRELEELLDYLRPRSPATARRIGLAIVGHLDLLARFPESGRLVEERGGAGYRRTVVGSYVIWYRAARDDVLVLGIRHGRRRPLDAADLERRASEEE